MCRGKVVDERHSGGNLSPTYAKLTTAPMKMMKPTHQLSPSWILLIAAASVILATTTTDAFAPQPPTPLTMTSRTSMYASKSETSFQRARLAEQLRNSYWDICVYKKAILFNAMACLINGRGDVNNLL